MNGWSGLQRFWIVWSFLVLVAPAWGGTADHAEHATAASREQERKILFYRNPMGLPDTSPTPKKDSMGMDYIPVYADEAAAAAENTVRINLDKVQKLGVRSEAASLRPVSRLIRAVGTVQVDERRLQVVTQKFEGWIEKLHADVTGQSVQQGQPLMEVYAPALVLAQQEYLAAVRASQALKEADAETRHTAAELAESALNRLHNQGLAAAEIKRLQKERTVQRTLTLTAPVSGVILEKNALQGMRFMPGEMLYRIADLSVVWVVAEVFEQDLGLVQVGQSAEITLNAMPGKPLHGKVSFIYPTLNSDTRTVKLRIELPNSNGALRPSLYATVLLSAPIGSSERLTVTDSALLDSGSRQVVLVERGEGLYEPRLVRVGGKGNGYVEILEGLKEGEKVVVRANFLIDAEANLKAALGHFSH
ncbi:MAG: efflux RND transporter periplasmic adaptor subunit [Magnetococcales bacterium]|nr:efflux RND transporter periplasmic adaptor subunit [Magnetococcales bacterium]MBF0114253.1 efflux RND transporter periplasmic adaptor subunit [Magnetococcales bacterium]